MIRQFVLSETPSRPSLKPKVKPKVLDTLVIDKVLYPLTFREGSLGYMLDGKFKPVDASKLIKHPVARGGSTTWFIKPEGRSRPHFPNP